MSFYGDFLVQLGIVRQDQLAAALAEQQEGRLRLGELAVLRGVLSPTQVDQVRTCQRDALHEHSDLRFGELAVALGFTTADAMDHLHREQRHGWRRIGEILVAHGVMDDATHAAHLRDFLHTEMIRRRRLDASLAEAPHPRVVEAMVDLARRWLPRFGLVGAKVVDVRLAPRAAHGVAWTGRRSMHGMVEVLTFLGVTTRALHALARATERPAVPDRPDLALPALAELVDTLTELGRSRLADLLLEPDETETLADDGYGALAELMAERNLVQVELVHGTDQANTERAVLTLVTREGAGGT